MWNHYLGGIVTILTLSPQTQKLIEERMKHGRYSNADDLLRAALHALHEREIEPLDSGTPAAIDRAEGQISRGECRDWEDAKAELRAKYLGKK